VAGSPVTLPYAFTITQAAPAQVFGRYGTYLLPQAYPEGAEIIAERLRAQIESIHIPGFGKLSASMGIATFPLHGGTRTELVVAADAALYSAKRSGRNRVCVFDAIGGDGRSIFSSDDPLLDILDTNM